MHRFITAPVWRRSAMFAVALIVSLTGTPSASTASSGLDELDAVSASRRLVAQQASAIAAGGTDAVAVTWNMNSGPVGASYVSVGGVKGTEVLCFSSTDPGCKERRSGNNSYIPNVALQLGPCGGADDVGCVEGVAAGTAGSGLVDAQFVESISSETPGVPENRQQRVPRGSTAGLWRGSSGDHLLVSVSLLGSLPRYPGKSGKLSPAMFVPRSLSASVRSVQVVDPSGSTEPVERRSSSVRIVEDPASSQKMLAANAGSCTPTRCTIPTVMRSDTRIRMTLRIPRGLETWLTGRLSGAVVMSKPISGERIRLSVEADALPAFHAGAAVARDTIPSSLRSKWIGRDVSPVTNYGFTGPAAFDSFVALEPHLGQRSLFTRNLWEFESSWDRIVGEGPDGRVIGAECLTLGSGLVGIVGTNAAVYDSSPPSWNATTGELSFRVASPHLDDTGAVAAGGYLLAIPRAVAGCLYGRSSLPPTVRVAITEDNGITRSETVSVANDENWVRFAASGFTFSAPRVTVQMGVGMRVRTGASLGAASLASAAGYSGIPSSVTVSTTSRDSKICTMRGSSVVGLKKGVCVVKVRKGAALQTLAVLVTASKRTSGQSLSHGRY